MLMRLKVSWAKVSVTSWAGTVMSSLCIAPVGHNYRAGSPVLEKSQPTDSDLGGQEMKVGMSRKKQVEGQQPLKYLLTSVGRQWVRWADEKERRSLKRK